MASGHCLIDLSVNQQSIDAIIYTVRRHKVWLPRPPGAFDTFISHK